MQTENLRINQLSPEVYDWYVAYLDTIDNKNVTAYGGFLDENCVMQSNNNAPVAGKEKIIAGLSEYWKTFSSLTHELINIYGSDTSFVLEALNHYERLDGGKVTVRAVAITDRNAEGLVTFFRYYTDASPVFAPASK